MVEFEKNKFKKYIKFKFNKTSFYLIEQRKDLSSAGTLVGDTTSSNC